MPISESDPRVFFAAERTLLAWVRTGITIMALGFVVSRFGLFIQLLALASSKSLPSMHSVWSTGIGFSLVMVGALSIIVACVQHRYFIASLPKSDLPHGYSSAFAMILSLLIGALGIVLAGYLIFINP